MLTLIESSIHSKSSSHILFILLMNNMSSYSAFSGSAYFHTLPEMRSMQPIVITDSNFFNNLCLFSTRWLHGKTTTN